MMFPKPVCQFLGQRLPVKASVVRLDVLEEIDVCGVRIFSLAVAVPELGVIGMQV